MKKKIVKVIPFLIVAICLLANLYPKADSSDIKSKINQYMERVTDTGFSGALLISINNKVILSRGYGMADHDKKLAVKADTVFTLGSITKQFTAAAILKLQMMGKLNVKDKIGKYLDDLPEDKKGITLHHLLTHTAGFPGAIGHDFDPIERDQFLNLVMKTKLVHSPGERYKYSNVGYSLLGIIVELVSGKSYEKFLNENLFKPAGMKNTGYLLPKWKKNQLAHGYRGDKDWGTLLDHPWASDGPGWHLRANGGILSTLYDMYKWHTALKGEKILDKKAKDLYYFPHVPEDDEGNSHYGYGWAIFNTARKTRLIAHDGGNTIFAADFLRYLDEKVVIIVFSNTAGKPAFRVSKVIAKIFFGEKYELPLKKIITFSMEMLKKSERGIRVLALIECIGKTKIMAENFIKKHIKPDLAQRRGKKIIDFLIQKNGHLGIVERGPVIQREENKLEAKIRSRKSGDWWKLTVGFDKKAPYLIDSIFIDSTEPPMNNKKSTESEWHLKWGLPNSQTGQKSAAILETLNRNDDNFSKNFIKNYYSPELLRINTITNQLKQIKKWQNLIGEIELLGARKTGPFSARLKVRSKKSKKVFQIVVHLENIKPNLIKSINIKE